jgi:hypothetical protein
LDFTRVIIPTTSPTIATDEPTANFDMPGMKGVARRINQITSDIIPRIIAAIPKLSLLSSPSSLSIRSYSGSK